eukprot:CAMPEP_0115871604 /NCGR_PEP_ID=MMETSP0287-20121206/22968_1 /TAXON_ID=412157 /ORGANISM="Chrysochromulina rotalis, Strain UIO044" /LENGTH=54 /DNA_ID=CAMNT_0003326443 /DNA_START=361 /DNA_END=525 /DNA_ORIENTATION=-
MARWQRVADPPVRIARVAHQRPVVIEERYIALPVSIALLIIVMIPHVTHLLRGS